MTALAEYEDGLDENGLPRSETMSILADPDNPKGTHTYVVDVARNWGTYALEMRQKDEAFSGENFLRSRKFMLRRVDRQPPASDSP
ncbi:hypothetical protein SCB71_14395 [Herbiconiux sp. KACC 21604]|uniref:hypothetical protein n=1 Tax=unclassified Herbiconiux TaxID=2618217 RepID=UPI001491D197|nr:hypothetical protein [Herbiconiux sp. SALV-R1]QJU54332.1 hypothetical protein HL652_12335 [Herbiconiux sp. SALV-R1]WPO85402.1 hypothetical protein SCB71_14395 [Herbiconiux sp. KACC 21604]